MEHDAILIDAEKDMKDSFNAVLGATIAMCIGFLFISINFDNFLTSIVDEEEDSVMAKLIWRFMKCLSNQL